MTPVVELNSLVVPDAPICYGILMPGDDTPGGVLVIKVRDYDHHSIDVDRLIRAAPAVEAPFRRSRLKAGDILMSIRGTTGVVAIVPPALDGANITQDTARIRTALEDRDYLYQALQAPQVQRQVRLHTVGQAVKGINIASVRRLAIPWPDQAMRRSISRTLGDCDALIRAVNRIVNEKQQFKRGLLQQLLMGRMRFPEFRHRPWRSSALGNHVVQVVRRNVSNLQLVLTASGAQGLVDQRGYFRRRVAGFDLTKYYELRRGEFAYNRSAMIGYPFGATKRLDEHQAGALSTLYLCFAISDPDLDSDYLRYVFDSSVLNRQLRRIARVGARAHGLLNVTDEDFFALNVPLPEVDEQRRIAELLRLVDKEIALLVAQREGVTLLKSGLVSRLLTDESVVPS